VKNEKLGKRVISRALDETFSLIWLLITFKNNNVVWVELGKCIAGWPDGKQASK